MDPWTSTRGETVPRPGKRSGSCRTNSTRFTVVLIHRAGPVVTVVVVTGENVRAGVGARRPAPSLGRSSSRVYGSPRRRRHHGVGWSQFEVRSASIESPIGWEMWAPGGCWGEGGSVSRLGENGEPYTSVEASRLASITSAVDAVYTPRLLLFLFPRE